GMADRPYLASMDALAAQGTTFDRSYSFPVCTPTRLCLLTGQYPRRLGIPDLNMNAYLPNSMRLPLEVLTVPKASGVYSVGFGKWHLGRAPVLPGQLDEITSGPFGAGFSEWRAGSLTTLGAGPGATGYYSWIRMDDHTLTLETTYATDAQCDAFITWWRTT